MTAKKKDVKEVSALKVGLQGVGLYKNKRDRWSLVIN